MSTAAKVTDSSVGGSFFRFSRGFWAGKHAARAWGWTIAVTACLLGQITMQVVMNMWNRQFFDALERKDVGGVTSQFLLLPILISITAVTVSCLLVSRMTLQARWREWVTGRLAGWWLADQRYYRLGFTAPEQSVPEYRIADDVRLSIEPLVEFVLGLLAAAITAGTFATILWQVAGSYRLPIGGEVYEIPAYMAIAAVIYATIASSFAFMVGRPLVARVSRKNEMEARFRSEMTRLRENSESIALIRGDKDELSSLLRTYQDVLKAWFGVIRQNGFIALVLNTNGALFPLIPLILVTPKFLAGELTLGAVMQVVAAFGAVQSALIWFVDNSIRLAEWFASASRVVELTRALEDIDLGTVMEDETNIVMGESDDGAIHIEGLSVADRAGRAVINDASIRIERGEKVMLTGESGSGKSILIRALAGLWPWGSGNIRLPRGAMIAFVPQRPYLPLGTLRAALTYPHAEDGVSEDVIVAAMKRCGLSYLVKRLDDEDRWDQNLSGGERQRVAFARLVIQKPPIIIMDEATSALDEESQHSLLHLLNEDLAQSTVISVAHRSGLEEFHTRRIQLEKRPAGAHMSQSRLSRSLWRMLRGPRRA
jgi:putative ATP-binding cassette transporter